MKVAVWAYNRWALHQFRKHFGRKAMRVASHRLRQARAEGRVPSGPIVQRNDRETP